MPPGGSFRKPAPGLGVGQAPIVSQLPPTFTPLRDIMDGKVSQGSMANVVGLVKDCRLPIPTRGTDYKSAITLFDISTQDDHDGVEFTVFRPESDMPQISARDVVVITQAKVQKFRLDPLSLIANYTTKIFVYTASKIPRPPISARLALKPSTMKDGVPPAADQPIHHYVSFFYHAVDKDDAPDEAEFQARAAMSLNVKDKFSLLKDVYNEKFCDLIVQVARDPFELIDKVTLYASDYTENDGFFNYTWDGVDSLRGANYGYGDPYGYTSGAGEDAGSSFKKTWVGPYGKKTIQLTCYEPHASIIRTDVKAGMWLSLRNVQIKHGHDGQNLEGFMREERSSHHGASKVNVDIFDIDGGFPDGSVDTRLKEAIRRCRDYQKKKKSQIKEIKSGGDERTKLIKSAEDAGAKRKAALLKMVQEEPSVATSKTAAKNTASAKRKAVVMEETRDPPVTAATNTTTTKAATTKATTTTNNTTIEDLDAAIQQLESKPELGCKEHRRMNRLMDEKKDLEKVQKDALLSLNELVTCEQRRGTPIKFIGNMLETVYYNTTIEGHSVELPCPFTCANYMASVRVVDFNPRSLEDFAISRKVTDFACLSDNESDTEDPSGDGSDDDDAAGAGVRRVWEWRFELQLEDATAPPGKKKKRLWVVVDNPEAQCLTDLDAVDLRRNAQVLAQLRERLFTLWGNLEEVKTAEEAAAKRRRLRDKPLDSDDEAEKTQAAAAADSDAVSNKPFLCCIKQFGVRAKNIRSSSAAAAGEEKEWKEWERVFALFGTRICV
ncbi:hypothetical protein B0T17DRAFT_516123 [Bombardia bombarda]|uniref:Protection of telomeres protein 1 n=1 Tax=Bombardia bombarda TaxID=252184 RepID=A0AA39XKJ9_9PEZI|nr:hypothetical protein B0T17DRAFT_516123 [Bombardia bombarda]